MSKVALRDDHVFIDAVGKNSQDTHIKVSIFINWLLCVEECNLIGLLFLKFYFGVFQ